MKPISTEDFITKTKRMGSKYDYSKVKYINNKTKIDVICPKHGLFSIRPDCHLYQNQGCKLCGIESRSKSQTIPESIFLDMLIKVHGNTFDYSDLQYAGMKAKVKLKCNICNNIFYAIAYNLIRGSGCRRCKKMEKSSTEEFIKKSLELHKDKFDYSFVEYKNCMERVTIKCNKCSEIFYQRPNDHLGGHGCPYCSKVYPLNSLEFIKRSILIHTTKYDYENVNYLNNRTKVKIFCKKCKVFFSQMPSHHLMGHGCPTCYSKTYRISKLEKNFLDEIGIKERQKFIGKMSVDGYDLETNAIYEFLGDYFHGNPEIFDSDDYNKTCHKTFGRLYEETFIKFDKLNTMGYNIYYIWENKWVNYTKNKRLLLPIEKYK